MLVDPGLCVACESCVDICPSVFSMDGEVAAAKKEDVAPDEEECAKKALESCPVDAISLKD